MISWAPSKSGLPDPHRLARGTGGVQGRWENTQRKFSGWQVCTSLLYHCDQIPEEDNLRYEGFLLAHCFKDFSLFFLDPQILRSWTLKQNMYVVVEACGRGYSARASQETERERDSELVILRHGLLPAGLHLLRLPTTLQTSPPAGKQAFNTGARRTHSLPIQINQQFPDHLPRPRDSFTR